MMKIFKMAIFSFCTASLSPDWEILSNTLKVAQQTGKLSDETELRSFEQKCLRTLFETRFPILTLERIGSFY